MLTNERCEAIMQGKDATVAEPSEGWARIDNTVVIYDHADPPAWLQGVLDVRNENGDTPQSLKENPHA